MLCNKLLHFDHPLFSERQRTSQASSREMHVIVFPWLAFGHMIPYLNLAKRIAKHGHQVSFISTPSNIHRLPKPHAAIASLIEFVPLSLPRVENLPENAEATMDVPPSDAYLLKDAFDLLQPELTRFLETSHPDWIIYDFAPYWLPPIAKTLNIKCAHFFVSSAWYLGFLGPVDELMQTPTQAQDISQLIVPPKWIPFESNLGYRKYQVNRTRSTASKFTRVRDSYRLGKVIEGCDVLTLRYSPEFDPVWLELLEKLHHPTPVVPLGFMPPTVNEVGGDISNTQSWVSIEGFLDKQNKRSVVYIAFGSEAALSQDELRELALGLELSGLPFCWILRKPSGSSEFGSVELPDGFEERTKDQGIVWKSWAPQVKILSHDSVGGFLTHCGWSSIIEGLYFGLPLIMLPLSVDMAARVLEGKKVGVEVARNEEDGTFTRDSVADSVKIVMVSEDGQVYRDNAMEMSSMFSDEDMQDHYIDKFIEYLENHRPKLDHGRLS